MMDNEGSRQSVLEFFEAKRKKEGRGFVEADEHPRTAQSISSRVLSTTFWLCLPHQEQVIPHPCNAVLQRDTNPPLLVHKISEVLFYNQVSTNSS